MGGHITRHAATHLAFGYGARYCIGAPLARIELQTVFNQLVSRFRALKLAADVEKLAVRDDALTRGLIALPCGGDPDRETTKSPRHEALRPHA
jgi:cytochrome P450